IKSELDLLAADSPLFPAVKVAAGFDSPQAAASEVGVQVTAAGLAPVHENRDLGPPPATTDDLLRARVSLTLRVSGSDNLLAPGPDVVMNPPAARLQQVDLVALSALTRLRQRPLPGPDGASPVPGSRPDGSAEAVGGTRRTGLTWQDVQVGEATVSEQGNIRTWTVPLTALVTYRLSPRPLEGGRILTIAVERPGDARIAAYAPAERLPLDYFRDLPDSALNELAGHGIHTLGDVGALGIDGVNAIVAGLKHADATAKQMLADMAGLCMVRKLVPPSIVPIDPDMLALPASCLLTPTPQEQLILDRVMTTVEIQYQVAALGLPAVAYLRTPQRAVVKVGHLLARERG
ncbi:MAG TPA: hypothetical protein VNT75_20805, partial [Symbiobacteriaceae bacterium]|nr:hypothetical protein [Symbiobacteriaceae bacterium]